MYSVLSEYAEFYGIIYSFLILIGFITIYYSINFILNLYYSTEFKKTGIKISKKFKIRGNKTEKKGDYELRYPKWLYSNRDGTKDKRMKYNELIHYESTLYYKEFKLTTKDPLLMIDLVKQIRVKFGDKAINKNKDERKKYENFLERKKLYNKYNDIQAIINECKSNPFKFEELCAELYKKMGYNVYITPKTNDGGYDLILYKNNEKCIVECKCFDIKNCISRPLIQKLVGANQTVKADKVIFITTSYFSSEAIEYSENAGVELIDGESLRYYMKKYSDNSITNNKFNIIKIKRENWELTKVDIKKNFPIDYPGLMEL